MNIFGKHDDRTKAQLQRCIDAEEGSLGVLCADGHVGYSMPIGGVVGYRKHVSPSGVGYDIACGNMAVQTNLLMADIQGDVNRIADAIQSEISFGVGRNNDEPVDSPVFDRILKSPIAGQRRHIQMARNQLGTVGSGNHYVDVLEDEFGFVWIACHFGSRGFGHKTATGFLNLAKGKGFDDRGGDGEMDAPPTLLDISAPLGQDYIEAMNIAGEYAYAGREAVITKVLSILGATPVWSVHNHHNFAWKETHGGESFWVVRKGATPAFPGQVGFVGGSMGDISVILRGVDTPESKEALYSTVHGAGRVMSRTQAAGKQKWTKARWGCGNYRTCNFSAPIADFDHAPNSRRPSCPKCGNGLVRQNKRMERSSDGLVDFTKEKAKLVDLNVVLRGAGADEAPPVYRNLKSVLEAHAKTIDIMHVLNPRIVVMAGEDVIDPYKD